MAKAGLVSEWPSFGDHDVTVLKNDRTEWYTTRTRISINGSFELDLRPSVLQEANVGADGKISYIAYGLGKGRFFFLPASQHTINAVDEPRMATIKIDGQFFSVLVDNKVFFSDNTRIITQMELFALKDEISKSRGSYYAKPGQFAKALESRWFQAWSMNNKALLDQVADADIELEKEALRKNWDRRAGNGRQTQFITDELDDIRVILGDQLFDEIILAPGAPEVDDESF
jgi:hypothetical protein